MIGLGWCRAVHVKNADMQKMRSLLANRQLLKRKPADIENDIRGTLRTYGWLMGGVGRGGHEARVGGTPRAQRSSIFCIEGTLDIRRAAFEGYERLHCVLPAVVYHDPVCRRPIAFQGVGSVAALPFKVGLDIPDALRGLERLERILT